MITFQEESFERAIPELKAIIPTHWNELALFKGAMELTPCWDEYINRERNAGLAFFTARKDGAIVAYYICFISPGLHYSSTLTAHMDIMYVIPQLRHGGIGVRLFAAVEKALKARAVQLWYSGFKAHAPLGMPKLLDHMGFKPADVYMAKWIGD